MAMSNKTLTKIIKNQQEIINYLMRQIEAESMRVNTHSYYEICDLMDENEKLIEKEERNDNKKPLDKLTKRK